MRPSARRRATVVAALLVGGGLMSSALAPSASAETDLTPAGLVADPSDDPVDVDVVHGPRAAVLALAAEDSSAGRAPAKASGSTPRAPRATRADRPAVLAPLTGYQLSARFGAGGRRWSSGRHTGQDFAAPTGTPVRAVAAGRVVEAGWDGPYGRVVVVAHGDGTRTRYAHLSSDAVSVGDRVEAGERIGRVGSSGNTTGSHLHLEVVVAGGPTDPARWLRAHGVRV